MIGLGFDENAQFCRLFDLVQLFPNAHSVNISNNFQILWMSRIINLELGLIDGTVSPVPLFFCFEVFGNDFGSRKVDRLSLLLFNPRQLPALWRQRQEFEQFSVFSPRIQNTDRYCHSDF